MKKILYIFIILFILTTGVFSFGYVANAEVVSAKYNPKGELVWQDKDANGKLTEYSVQYGSSDNKVFLLVVNGKSTTKSIYKNSNEEKDLLNEMIPGGVASVRVAEKLVTNKNLDIPAETKKEESKAADERKREVEAFASRAAYDAKDAGQQTECFNRGSFKLFPEINWASCAAVIANQVLLRIAAILLWVAAWLFNFTLSYSLNMGAFLETVPIVDIGWKILRDVANLCIIFILLYIAINTILQANVANSKKLLGTVIIVAVLLNFSLFFTKVVIDTSNILALQFYQKMGGQTEESIGTSISKKLGGGDVGIAQTFMKGLGLSGLYNAGKGEVDATNEKFKAGAWTTYGNVLAVSLGGFVLITITALVFFAASFMFLIRTVVLIFIMILSPLAFLSLALPSGSAIWSKWSKMLISQSFFAPIYLMLVYLVVAIIKGDFGSKGIDEINGGRTMNLATFLTGNGSAVGTLYVFVVLIAMMLGSLFIASSMGAVGAKFSTALAGKMTLGAGGFLGRQTIGRTAKAIQESKWVKNMVGNKDSTKFARFVGGQLERGSKRVSESSFDMRNTALGGAVGGMVGGLGDVGGKAGFAKSEKDSQKEWEDLAKRAGTKSETEKLAIERVEEERRLAEATQADLLLDVKEKAEKTIIDDNLEEKKTDALNMIASLETTKALQIKILNDKEIAARNEYTKKFAAWEKETDPTKKHAREVEKDNADNNAKSAKVMKEKATLGFDEAIAGQRVIVQNHDEQVKLVENSKIALQGINSNYKAKGSEAENASITTALRANAQSEGAKRYKSVLTARAGRAGVDMNADFVNKHIKEEIDTRVKRINDAVNKRAEGTLEEGFLPSRARKEAYRNWQKNGKKDSKDKAQDALDEIFRKLEADKTK